VRVARVAHDGAARAAVVADDRIRVLEEGLEVLDLLAMDADSRGRLAQRVVAELEPADVRLLAPLEPATLRDFATFETHIEGASMTVGGLGATVPAVWYEKPFCYFSNPHAITGPDDDIKMAPGTQAQDFELEVAAIISSPGRNLRPDQARSCIGGFTIFNDWSARDIGGVEIQTPFGQCKAKDFANTLGPWIVTPDELEQFRVDDRYDLGMQAFINGRPVGNGDTLANMAWSFEEMVSYASRGTCVRPGDVLGSGTCQNGCLLELWGRNGSFDDPPPLRPGDVVTLEVEGIGTLTNRVVEGDELHELPKARPANLLRERQG